MIICKDIQKVKKEKLIKIVISDCLQVEERKTKTSKKSESTVLCATILLKK